MTLPKPWEDDPLLPLYRAIAAERPDRVTVEARALLQIYSVELADLRWQQKMIERLIGVWGHADNRGTMNERTGIWN